MRTRKRKHRKLDSLPRLPVTGGRAVRNANGRIPVVDPAVRVRMLRLRVAPVDLTWKCEQRVFSFRSTREVPPLKSIPGQRQALRTMEMGLRMNSPGYNLFICGLNSTDSNSLLERYISSLGFRTAAQPDRCYVQNFRDPHRPKLLELPPGQGSRLQVDVRSTLERLHRALAKKPEHTWKKRAKAVLEGRLPGLLDRFPQPALRAWLLEWKRSLLANLHHAALEDYEVNCLGRSSVSGRPVVVERNPTHANLFGWVSRRAVGDEAPAPHFTGIKAGSLLDADGGVLVLQLADFQFNPGVWSSLKNCLKYGLLQIDEGDSTASARPSGLKPEPIPLRVKVVLLGDYVFYDQLFEAEPDFRDVFKIRVDFDSEVPLTSRVLRREYPAFLARICQEGGLRPVSPAGVSRILEFAVRKAGRKNKITTQAWVVADLLREADYWAGVASRRLITGVDVKRAVAEGIQRVNLVETKIAEMISEGTILITTSGSRVGQVNGLAIYDMGDYLFAKPSRITAETSMGEGGIINIEREAGFSGRSHDKGIHILAGYLRSRFAQKRPLSLTASVCFEQSYSGIDGDSASATEIYALLSSLSGLPIRQDIAVTGSLNQKGDMQPIGGVNEKIEGFYDCVRAGRWTGKEGVIVPQKNVDELMLRDDIVEAVARRRFHIYAIDTIEQGIEILTGVPVGRRRKDGTYTPGSVFDRADRRLEEIAQGLKKFDDNGAS